MKCVCLFFTAFLLLGSSAAFAQQFTPPPNKNAALRYWMAFAEMADHSADEATTKLMEDVLSGAANWDEQRLGPILDENSAAVHTLQRAMELSDCNWGLEYSRGAAMSLGHLPKARALARLNALYGARQMAQGNATESVNTWLAGLRFAQHVGKDLSLIGVLSARPALVTNLHLLTRGVQSGAVNTVLQNKIRAQLQQLPKDGLDWEGAIRAEAWADEQSLKDLANVANFQESYKSAFGGPPPPSAQPPSAADIAGFRTFMNEVVIAFRLSYPQTQARLAEITSRTKNMNPVVRAVVPNYLTLNETRKQVSDELQLLDTALTGQK